MDIDQAAGPGPGSAVDAADAKTTRTKGRPPGQLRTLVCERSILNRADGSAKWSQGESVVLAAVHGPRQANARREDAEKGVVEVVFKPMGVPGRAVAGTAVSPHAAVLAAESRVFERIIKGTLEAVIPLGLHPRTSTMVVLQVIQADGSLLTCALNAACAALVDAGVPMLSLFASVTCAVVPGGTMVVDPDDAEEKTAQAIISLTFPHHLDFVCAAAVPVAPVAAASATTGPNLVVEQGLLTSQTSGAFSDDQYFDAFEVCRQGCRSIAAFSQQSLVKSLQAV